MRRLAKLAKSGQTVEYRRARAVTVVLWRYERACRLAGRPGSVMLEGGQSSRAEGKPERRVEREVALIADVERLLGALTQFERAVVALVGVRRLSESTAAARLGTARIRVAKTYWQAVDALYWLMVGACYVRPIGEGDGEEQSEETGSKSPVAEVEPGVAAGREAREAVGA